MLSTKKRMAAVLMAVVMIITAVNFFPFGAYRTKTVKQETWYSAGAQAEEQAEKTDTVMEAEEAAERENETAAPEEQEDGLIEETTGTSETETATEKEIVTEVVTEEQESETELRYEEVPDMQSELEEPDEPVALNAGAMASVTERQNVSYGASYGHSYIVNDGSIGYSAYCCAKDNNNTPNVGNSGTVTDITDWGNGPTYRRIFYFGCLPAYSFDSEAQRVLAVSQTLSAYYSGTSNTFSAFDNATKGFTVPSASVSVTAPASAQATIEGNMQKTGIYTINADGHTSVSVTIPDGTTLYSGGNAYTGTASLGNGAQFYLTASLDTTGTLTGTVTGGQTVNRVYLLDFGGSTQQLMFADWVTPSASYSATFSIPRGNLEIKKTSANQEITNGNPCYSLKGAVYTLYKNTADANANRNVVTTLTTDADGYAKADNLELGNYILKETKNPPGYALDTRLYPVTITAGQTTAFKINLTDLPQMDPVSVLLTKQDEVGTGLAGAEYTFRFYNEQMNTDPAKSGKVPQRTWVFRTNEYGVIQLSNVYKVSGDDFYYNSLGNSALPTGTLTIQETKAPKGYLLDDTVYVRQITSSGTAEAVSTYNAPTVIEHQIRGDIAFTKKDAATGEPIGSVKFSITDEEGEAHIIWTDENGYYSTVSDHIPHSSNTNSDEPGAGIWFGSTEVDNNLGALHYGTYTIKELRCEANKNRYKDLAAFTIEVKEHGTVVDYGDVTNERFPTIRTEAWDTSTGTNLAAYGETIYVTDTCYLDNLDVGHTYTIRGKVMLPDTGEALIQNGNEVTAEKTFTATASATEVDVSRFVINTDGLAGKDIVLFEYLYDAAYPDEVIAVDEDLHNLSQTIHFPEIGTTAKDSVTDTHEALAREEVTVVDTVRYENLIAGKEYVLSGTIMDKETGEPLVVGGEPVTASKTFIPEQKSGTVDISFTFDGSALAGKDIVVFEDVYHEGKLIAVHADIEDGEQTIWFPKIGTTAKDSVTDTHEALAREEVTVVDTVRYENLIAGKEYVLSGTIMDKETGEPLMVGGEPVTASKTFTPEQKSGTVDISFTFDGSALAGKDIVVFEDVYHEGKLIAVHADIEDKEQTIRFPEIGTTAKDSVTGNHDARRATSTTIVDTVVYKNLTPGKNYHMEGIVYDYDTGEPLEIDGETVTAELDFVPETESGTVDMEYTFKSLWLHGKRVVVFEYLYADHMLLAVHADIEDEGQSVIFDNYVGRLVLDNASGPAAGGWHRNSPQTPQTGDAVRPFIVFIIMFMCAAGMCVFAMGNRKKRKVCGADSGKGDRKGKRKIISGVLVTAIVGMSVQLSVKAEESYDYVLTETDVYKTQQETEYDFGFEQSIEVSGVTYNLDYVEYDTVNLYAAEFSDDEPVYEITREESGITEDEKETFKPAVASITGEYTYEYSGVEFKAEEADSAEMTSYIDTDIITGNFNPSEYPQTVSYTYEDGKEYMLPYSGYEKLEEGWYGGYVFPGRIEYYDAPTYMLGQSEMTEDMLAVMGQEGLNNLLHELGYSEMYRATAAWFDGDAYTENDITYRNYRIEAEVYGVKYRLIYKDTAELPLYTAVITYTMSDAERESIEELKESYEVTAYAYYTKVEQEQEKKQGLSVSAKIALGSGIVLLVLFFAALVLYLVKGGRKPTDYKSKRDARRDYKNL